MGIQIQFSSTLCMKIYICFFFIFFFFKSYNLLLQYLKKFNYIIDKSKI